MEKGDPVEDDEYVLRAIFPLFIKKDGTISSEAFRPRIIDEEYEKGVSCFLKKLQENNPYDEPQWISRHECKIAELLAYAPNIEGYPVIFTPSSKQPYHCEISGDMEKLFQDEQALSNIAEAADIKLRDYFD